MLEVMSKEPVLPARSNSGEHDPLSEPLLRRAFRRSTVALAQDSLRWNENICLSLRATAAGRSGRGALLLLFLVLGVSFALCLDPTVPVCAHDRASLQHEPAIIMALRRTPLADPYFRMPWALAAFRRPWALSAASSAAPCPALRSARRSPDPELPYESGALSECITTNSGVRMPRLIFGTSRTEEHPTFLFSSAVRAGFRGLDVALQPGRRFEASIGKALASLFTSGIKRESLFIQTHIATESSTQNPDMSITKQVEMSIANSLANLGLEHVDSLVLHSSYPEHEQTMEAWCALEDAVHAGLVRQLGLWHTNSFESLVQLRRVHRDAALKPAVVLQSSSATALFESELRAWCSRSGIHFQSSATLAPFLTLKDSDPSAVEAIEDLAKKYGVTLPVLYFRFVMGLGMVPLTGTSRVDHMIEDISAASVPLTEEDAERISGMMKHAARKSAGALDLAATRNWQRPGLLLKSREVPADDVGGSEPSLAPTAPSEAREGHILAPRLFGGSAAPAGKEKYLGKPPNDVDKFMRTVKENLFSPKSPRKEGLLQSTAARASPGQRKSAYGKSVGAAPAVLESMMAVNDIEAEEPAVYMKHGYSEYGDGKLPIVNVARSQLSSTKPKPRSRSQSPAKARSGKSSMLLGGDAVAHKRPKIDDILSKTQFSYSGTLSSEQQEVLNDIAVGKSVFFTGCAGTGKSFLLRHAIKVLQERYPKKGQVAVCASTGVAACALGGVTVHSWAGVGLGEGSGEALLKSIFDKKWKSQKWNDVKALVIDEISMLDGVFLDKLEFLARAVRSDETPFGGIQVVLSGDFFQLPPVGVSDRPGKAPSNTTFCFDAACWEQVVPSDRCYVLSQVFRQNDPEFVRLLSEVRRGGLMNPEVCKVLSATASLNFGDVEPTRLFPYNADADRVNTQRLQQLAGEQLVSVADDTGNEPYLSQLQKNCPAPGEMVLKQGAQVLLLKNLDVENGLVNGARGTILRFEAGDTAEDGLCPVIQFQVPRTASMSKSITRRITREEFVMEDAGKPVAKRKQLPLRLAWAISIHKSQGMTIDYLEVDLGSVFECGQAYVALSRATSLERLRVKRFSSACARTHPSVLKFDQKFSTAHAKMNFPVVYSNEQDLEAG